MRASVAEVRSRLLPASTRVPGSSPWSFEPHSVLCRRMEAEVSTPLKIVLVGTLAINGRVADETRSRPIFMRVLLGILAGAGLPDR